MRSAKGSTWSGMRSGSSRERDEGPHEKSESAPLCDRARLVLRARIRAVGQSLSGHLPPPDPDPCGQRDEVPERVQDQRDQDRAALEKRPGQEETRHQVIGAGIAVEDMERSE